MPQVESGIILPALISFLESSGADCSSIQEYPTYGYYNKNDVIQLYYQLVRNCQSNEAFYSQVDYEKSNINTYRGLLKPFIENPVFGAPKIKDHSLEKSPPLFEPRADLVTYSMCAHNAFLAKPWSIDSILEKAKTFYKRTKQPGDLTLLDLAFATKNVACLHSALTTNCLYRQMIYMSGAYFPISEKVYLWKVSREVQNAGQWVVENYNKLFQIALNNDREDVIICPTIFNHSSLSKKPDTSKVCCLGQALVTGEYYYWLRSDNGVRDIYSSEIITDENVEQFYNCK